MRVLILVLVVVTGGKQSQLLLRPTKVGSGSTSSEWSLTTGLFCDAIKNLKGMSANSIPKGKALTRIT